MISPMQRSIARLKKDGYIHYITEHYNPFSRTKNDLFGFCDLVAMKSGVKGLLAIQTTSTGNISSREKKIKAEPRANLWLECVGPIQIWGWSKKGERGKTKHWTLTIREVVLPY